MIESLVNIIPQNDEKRLEALLNYEILYTPAEESFDNITQIMAQVFKMPMAFISLVDRDHVFYKSKVGQFGHDQVRRVDSLCSLTILGNEPLIIEDASVEDSLLKNPYVAVDGGIKFYAGAPLLTKEGYSIGTACVVDTKSRTFNEENKKLLERFAKLVMHEIEMRQALRMTVLDATDEVVARRKVEGVKETLTYILEALPEKAWTANKDGEANYLTKGWYDYTGQKTGEAVGKGWAAAVHPDDVEGLLKKWQETVNAGVALHHEARVRNKEGEYRWHHLRSVPIYNAEGNVFLWGGTLTDIHDKKAKTEELERKVWERTIELERSNKNLEEFAYAASHDLKAPIRKIMTFSDRLKTLLQEKLEDQHLQYFERIDKASIRMNTLIDDLLAYSSVRNNANALEDVDLNHCIDVVLEDLEIEIQEKNSIVTIETLPTVKGHRRQLQQALQNLISNALKYTKPDMVPEVNVRSKRMMGYELPISFPGMEKEKEYYLIEVSDNGIGFEQKDADRIFNVFTRLHGNHEYRGTGIGLSIVRKVIENHGGVIWAESEPDKGATFKILLPKE